MAKFTYVLVVCSSLALFSCQKEISNSTVTNGGTGNNNSPGNNQGNNNNASIQGNWTFISMSVKASSQQQASIGPIISKTVTLSDYTTQDNKGDVTIDATKMSVTNLSYSVNSIAKAYMYENNVLQDSIDMPLQLTLPPYNATTTYKLIGADSISLSSGTMMIGGSTQQTLASGGKYKIEGNKLYITQQVHQTKTQTIQGTLVSAVSDAIATAVYQRK